MCCLCHTNIFCFCGRKAYSLLSSWKPGDDPICQKHGITSGRSWCFNITTPIHIKIGDKPILVSKTRIADAEIHSGWKVAYYIEHLLQMFFGWVCRELWHFDDGIGNVWLGSKHDVEQWCNDWLISTSKSSVCFFVWIGSQIVPGRKWNWNSLQFSWPNRLTTFST